MGFVGFSFSFGPESPLTETETETMLLRWIEVSVGEGVSCCLIERRALSHVYM